MTDAASTQVLPDAFVTVQSAALGVDQLAVTDAAGQYRVGSLPAGSYTVRVERVGYRGQERADIRLEAGAAATVNAALVPEGQEGQPLAPPSHVPAVDLSRSPAGGALDPDFAQGAAVVRPGDRFSAGRSLELWAATLPGARLDPLGLSLGGASALEKQVLVDGISAVDPATGALLLPLSLELLGSLEVLSGGYLPEHGRAAGGTLLVETRSGSNEWHGAVHGQWAPGALEGERTVPVPRLSSLSLSRRLWNQGDLGAQLSGPLVRDRLWLFVGVQGAAERTLLTRRLYRMQLAADPSSGLLGYDVDPATGLERSEEIPGAARSWFGDFRQLQYAARLTWLPDPDRTFNLSVAGVPSESGGPGRSGYDPLAGDVLGWDPGAPGAASAVQRGTSAHARVVSLRGSSAFWDRALTVDAALGWYHQRLSVLAPEDAAGLPQVIFRNGAQPGPHALGDFAAVLARGGDPLAAEVLAACADGPNQAPGVRRCPLPLFLGGGPGKLGRDLQDRLQARASATYLASILGSHAIKAGGEVELAQLDRLVRYSGGALLREGDPEATLDDLRAFGSLDALGQPVRFGAAQTVTRSLAVGAFLQDSWHLLDLLHFNLGLRWDGQTLAAPDGGEALALWSQLSPRVGLAYDVSALGKSKVHGSFSRYTQSVPLELVQRAFGGEQHALTRRLAGGACDVTDPGAWLDPARCGAPANVAGSTAFGSGRPIADALLQPTTVDELLVGAEYEFLPALRAAASYTRRRLVRSVRELTQDGGRTSFIANPGVGLGQGFDAATREYDAITVSLDRSPGGPWMAHLSYTWSQLRGNDPGLFEPPTRLRNGTGPLPGDRLHSVKLFGGGELALPGSGRLTLGGAYLAESGGPTSALASDPYYGDGAVFLLPRGSGPRLPWVHSVDLHLAYRQPLPSGLSLQVSLDAFNVLNLQAVTAVDERYTLSDAVPLDCSASCSEADLPGARTPSGQPVVPNPGFGRPLAYQLPRTIRFGAKLAF